MRNTRDTQCIVCGQPTKELIGYPIEKSNEWECGSQHILAHHTCFYQCPVNLRNPYTAFLEWARQMREHEKGVRINCPTCLGLQSFDGIECGNCSGVGVLFGDWEICDCRTVRQEMMSSECMFCGNRGYVLILHNRIKEALDNIQ